MERIKLKTTFTWFHFTYLFLPCRPCSFLRLRHIVVHARLLDLIQSQWESYKRVENIHKLLEIQRDLVGLSALPLTSDAAEKTPNGDISNNSTSPSPITTPSTPWGPLLRMGRQFIREGWLQKLSKKGYQPRIFFLFSDQLVYASRMATTYLQFKVIQRYLIFFVN